MRAGPEVLQFHSRVQVMRSVFEQLPDPRLAHKVVYPLCDVACAGLAMMFWQDAGVLAFQQRLQDRQGFSNLQTQDCEINAAKRLLPKLAKMYCHLDIVLLADSLYSKSPIIDLVQSLNTEQISCLATNGRFSRQHVDRELLGGVCF